MSLCLFRLCVPSAFWCLFGFEVAMTSFFSFFLFLALCVSKVLPILKLLSGSDEGVFSARWTIACALVAAIIVVGSSLLGVGLLLFDDLLVYVGPYVSPYLCMQRVWLLLGSSTFFFFAYTSLWSSPITFVSVASIVGCHDYCCALVI